MDAELNHSSGYFLDGETSLDRAQRAKVDAILARCDLRPSMRVLDAGSGWGATARVAADRYGADVTGITLSGEQHRYACERQEASPTDPPIDFRIQRWEDFSEPVDRIICINAFENFENKRDFFSHCRSILPDGGIMVILTVTADRPMFRVISKEEIIERGRDAGFDVQVSDSLASHYIRTLECFVDNLEKRRKEAEAEVGKDRLDKMVAYYVKSAGFLRSGLNDMFEFTFVAR
ncbi:class I SAM-dependent methyltransferase [Streptomyces sp. NPDC051569]|uniref:class I SAM-dependent methyltransferase n=1 Tax=Streptomyces sp. NPDC051569 TaxID=3365661 RepID=UPI003792E27F